MSPGFSLEGRECDWEREQIEKKKKKVAHGPVANGSCPSWGMARLSRSQARQVSLCNKPRAQHSFLTGPT
jgi:hypothetical protein